MAERGKKGNWVVSNRCEGGDGANLCDPSQKRERGLGLQRGFSGGGGENTVFESLGKRFPPP